MRVLIVSVLLLFMAGHSAIARDAMEGKPAPHLDGKYLDGAPFDLRNLRGKVVIVTFWATWCPSCRKEMPVLEALYRKYHAQGLEIIAISIDDADAVADVKALMRNYSYPAAMISAVDADDFGRIWRLPLTFVIDRQGVLRKDAWESDPIVDERALEELINPLIAAR